LDNGSHAPDRLRVFLKKGQRFIVVSPRVFQRCTAVGWLQP
jgi:siroheme synthase (precorrin-2 oxidase/ferrochelatase)